MTDLIHAEPAPTLEEIWRLFKETDRKFQETDRRFIETDRQFKETDRQLKETDRQLRETAQRIKEIGEQIGHLGNRLGEFVEGLVAPALIKLFQARGIDVCGLSRDLSRKNSALNLATQIDLFAVNGDVCILIEVKSKFSIEDVHEHLERMKKFKLLYPEYADKQALGAVVAMVMPDDVAKYAYRKGFFVLAQKGEAVVILNDEQFKPQAW